MDSNKYVPLAVIENFGKVKSLTTDSNLIIEVLSNSKVVELDDTKTKIKSKILDQQRTTIILRDILADSTVQEIEEIFTNFEEKVTEVKFDIGNTCFVSFSSEKAALAALNFVKTRTYRETPIKARIKNETILRSCNAVKPVQTNQHYYPQQYQPYQYVPGAWNIPRQHQEFDQEFRNSNRGDPRSKPNQRKRKDNTSNNTPNNSNNNSNNSRKSNNTHNNHNNNDKRQGRGGGNQKKKGSTGHNAGRKNSADFQLGGSYFPPLVANKSPNDSESSANDVSSKQTLWSQVVNVAKPVGNNSKAAPQPAPSPSVDNQGGENNNPAPSESASNY